ncbi:MAG: DUF4202 domain-containing protein [Actinomycetota bacterium]
MRSLSQQLLDACAVIDAANALDPTVIVVRGESVALALAHGRLATDWVRHLNPEAGDALVIAARAHHLRRWEVPRTTYPEGKAGYLRWRKDQKARHARDVEVILNAAGYDALTIQRVQVLIRREQLKTDPDTQVLEDAACLVFIETQLAEMAPRFDRDHLLEVIRKTAAKMSAAGLAAVALLPIGAVEHELLAAALA